MGKCRHNGTSTKKEAPTRSGAPLFIKTYRLENLDFLDGVLLDLAKADGQDAIL